MIGDCNAILVAVEDALSGFDDQPLDIVAYALVLSAARRLGEIENADKREEELDIVCMCLSNRPA